VPPTLPPTEAPAPTAAAEYVEYTVQRGDSLKLIAQRYGVTVRDIIAVNQIPNPDSLNVGSVVRIPKK
jgi:LysM repeat protein